jgi:hypothetical protein
LIAGARRDSLRVGVLDAKKMVSSYQNKTEGEMISLISAPVQESGATLIAPKLRSMHPIKRQNFKIRYFASKMLKMLPKHVRLTLSSAMKAETMKKFSVKYRKNHTLKW